jgi:hypothetical protein
VSVGSGATVGLDNPLAYGYRRVFLGGDGVDPGCEVTVILPGVQED